MWKMTLGLGGFLIAGVLAHLALFPLEEGTDGVVGIGHVIFRIPAIAIAGYLLGLGVGTAIDRRRDSGHWRRDRARTFVSVLFALGLYVIYACLA